MTPELLTECGRTLYGQQWQTALARDLGVNDRNIRRWAAGIHPVPAGLRADLVTLLKERGVMLDALAERLSAA